MCVRPVSRPTTARHAVSTSTASPGVGAHNSAIPVTPRMAVERVTRRTPRPHARTSLASDDQCSARQRLNAPSDSVTSATDSSSPGHGRACRGRGWEKSASSPKSAQMRARMSLIPRRPTACSNSGEPHQKSRCSGWSRRSTTRSGRWHVVSASASTRPARPSMRSASRAWPAARVTSHASSPVASAFATTACTAGRDTTRSPSPNEIGATNVRATTGGQTAA